MTSPTSKFQFPFSCHVSKASSLAMKIRTVICWLACSTLLVSVCSPPSGAEEYFGRMAAGIFKDTVRRLCSELVRFKRMTVDRSAVKKATHEER